MTDMLQLSPVLLAACTGLFVLVVDLFRPAEVQGGGHLAWITAMGFALAGAAAFLLWPGSRDALSAVPFAGALRVDAFSLFLWVLLLACGALACLASVGFDVHNNLDNGEYYSFFAFAVAGMMVMVAAADMLTLFIGLETMSLSLYPLIAMKRDSLRAAEGSFKYFINGAVASALLLYGLALTWGETGTLKIPEVASLMVANSGNPLLFAAATLILVGFAFKVALVPFHMWTPDAYEAAPAPVTGFMASAVKAAAFATLLRFVFSSNVADIFTATPFSFVDMVIAVSVLTMTVGNLVALHQDNVKRMLAYSSISHAGYLALALTLVPPLGSGVPELRFASGSALFYLAAYGVSTLLAFGVLARLAAGGSEEATVSRLKGLSRRRPGLAFLLTLGLISLAGFPPTAGFFAKFYLFREMLVLSKGKLVILVVIAVVNALVSVYYYLRPVVAMYMDDAAEDREEIADSTASFALLVAALAVVLMGLLPQPITDIASKAGKAVWYENATGIQDGPVGALAPFARTGSKEDSDRDASNPAGALPK